MRTVGSPADWNQRAWFADGSLASGVVARYELVWPSSSKVPEALPSERVKVWSPIAQEAGGVNVATGPLPVTANVGTLAPGVVSMKSPLGMVRPWSLTVITVLRPPAGGVTVRIRDGTAPVEPLELPEAPVLELLPVPEELVEALVDPLEPVVDDAGPELLAPDEPLLELDAAEVEVLLAVLEAAELLDELEVVDPADEVALELVEVPLEPVLELDEVALEAAVPPGATHLPA